MSTVIDRIILERQLVLAARATTLTDLERAFVPLSEAGLWNRHHPFDPITKSDIA